MKKALLAVVLLLAAGVGLVYLKLDWAVKRALETYGSRMLQARVSVRAVHLSPFTGEGSIRGLEIGSPAGFSEPYVLRVDSVRVSLEPASLRTRRIVVREVAIEKPELRYERNASGSNLDALQRNLGAGGGGSSSASKGSDRKLVIKRFSARGGTAAASLFGARAQLALPDIEARDIGEGGAAPQQVAQKLLAELANSAAKAVGGTQNIGGAINNALKGLLGR